ncbi:MAG TPA: aminotransferase class I/II-fold pyridoxal phosphate-dependent enzyme [Solirubrobacteraceae bacterium]|nr:aminotransferase class I/II-fold pyridoxal phosphate-dependent enzyme [Solirubrobacteraceae bacterium]
MAIDLSVPDIEALHRRAGAKWAAYDPDVLSLTIAEMDFALAPPVAEALHRAIDRADLGYPGAAHASLRRSFSGFASRRLAWGVDGEQIVLVPDVMIGLVELCRVIAEPGEAVAFATPAYPPFFSMLPAAGVGLIEIDLLADGSFDLDALDAALAAGARALVLASPHNPTGRVLPRAELEAIAERCAEREAWVLADEIHAPLTLPGATHLPWLEVSDAARRWGVSLTSASKAFNLAALKAALIVTADPAARDLVARMRAFDDHAGLLGVIAAEAAFEYGDAWLDAVIDQLAANREQLGRELAEHLPGITWTPPQATYLAWFDCTRLGLGDDPAEAFLTEGRVALSPGRSYGAPGAGHARLNLATSPAHLSEAVARMARASNKA